MAKPIITQTKPYGSLDLCQRSLWDTNIVTSAKYSSGRNNCVTASDDSVITRLPSVYVSDYDRDLADNRTPLVNMTMTSHDVTTTTTAIYDGPSALVRFSVWYSGVHGYLCIAVCVFGIASNILNIVVLTHRRMASSSTNFILTALAISDLLPMLSYLPYAVYFHCLGGVQPVPRQGFPLAWIVFLLFNNSFIITSHTVSVWLTVTLAVFRYITVCHHAVARRICSLWHARVAAACIVVAAVVVCLPTYLMYEPRQLSTNAAASAESSAINNRSFGFALSYGVKIPQNLSMAFVTSNIDGQQVTDPAGGPGYWFEHKQFVGPTFETVNFWVDVLGFLHKNRKLKRNWNRKTDCRKWWTIVRWVNFWVYGVALKTAPCILLTVLSALLIRAMRAAELRHRRLVRRRPVMSSISAASPRTDTQSCTVRRHHTFEEPKTQELNGAKLGVDLAPWRRSFSERIPRSTALSTAGESVRLGTATTSAEQLPDNPSAQRTVDFVRKDRKNSTVIAQTVDGDVIVELTGVDDENSAAERFASDQSIHEAAGSSSHQRQVCKTFRQRPEHPRSSWLVQLPTTGARTRRDDTPSSEHMPVVTRIPHVRQRRSSVEAPWSDIHASTKD